MSDYDRGAYAPESDDRLAFDPRQVRRSGPAPLSLIVSVVVLLAIVAGAYLFYRHGVRKAGEAPQVVGAPITDTRTPPPSSAQASDESAGLQVYKTEAPSAAATSAPAPTLEAPPEQPQPLPAPRPAPVAMAPLKGEAVAPAAPAPVARTAPAEAKSAPPKAAAPKPAAPALRGLATAAPIDVAAAGDTSAAPARQAAPAAKPARPQSDSASSTAGAGAAVVQIGAFADSAQADKTWGDIARAMPGQMKGKTRKVEAVAKDGKTLYRAYVGGFASRADAASFCASLKAAGKPCFVK